MDNGQTAVPQLVSVIVPVHNNGKFLEAALSSIFVQDYRPIEVIVVDDGSTDNSGAIARSFSDVRYYYQEKQGSAVARNNGIDNSSGELIAFLDADDIWISNKLSVQAAYLQKYSEMGYVCGRMKNFLENGITCPTWIDPNSLLQASYAIQLGTILARRFLFDVVGNFNPSYMQGQDTEWFLRVSESGVPFIRIAETVLLRRIHNDNISHDQSTVMHRKLRMLKESIDRKLKADSSAQCRLAPSTIR